MENSPNENLLFVTRGNKLQLFDLESETVQKEFKFPNKLKILDLQSGYSDHQKYYYVS